MSNSAETTTNVLGLPLFRLGMDAALKVCSDRAAAASGGYACFVNVHSLTESQDDSRTDSAIRNATLAFPDGLPLIWASKLGARPICERVCGPDFMTALLTSRPGDTFGFIGGQPGQAERIGERFGIRALAYSPPFRPFSEANAAEDWLGFVQLARSKFGKLPRFVWVCLGAPKQELWMEAVAPRANGVFFFGVGAAIDFLAGTKSRAPVWMQKCGLEWFYRLLQEPGRLWQRYFQTNTRFIFLLLREHFGRKKRVADR